MIEAKFVSLNLADTIRRENPEIKPAGEKLSEEQVVEYSEQLAELAVERGHLGHLLYLETGQTKAIRKGEKGKPSLRERLVRRVSKTIGQQTIIKERGLSLEEELTAITEGRIAQVFREKTEEPAQRIKDRLKAVEAEIKNLVAYPQVVEHYRKEFNQRVQILKDVREIEKLRKWIEALEANNETLVLRRQAKGLSQPDEEILSRNQKRIAAAQERIALLQGKPEVSLEKKRRELVTYRKQLLEEGFVETPTVRKLLNNLAVRVSLGKPVLLWGHTGTGKTETLRHLTRKLLRRDPEIFSGSDEVTHYDLFGKTQLRSQGTYFQDGPAVKALREAIPLLIDEVDLVPHAIIGRLQDLLTRRPGQRVTIQENSNEALTVPHGFIIFATGNLRSAKYRREELDPAFLRRFWQTEVKYLPEHETYDIFLSALIDRRGSLRVKSRTDIEEGLVNLCKAAKFVQDVFTGGKTDFMGEGAEASRGIGASLEKATLSIGDLLNIVQQWKAENFSRPLEDYILSEFIQSQTVRRDQLNLVKIFCLHGFFQEKKAEDFEIPGLTQQKLLAYRTEASQTS